MLWINGGTHDPIGLDYHTDDTLCAPRIHQLSLQYRDLVRRLLVTLRGEEYILWQSVAQDLVNCAADLLEVCDFADLRREFLPANYTHSERIAAYKGYLFDIARTRAAAYRSTLEKDLTLELFKIACSAVSWRSYCAANNISLELRDVVGAPPSRPIPRPLAAFLSAPAKPAHTSQGSVCNIGGRTALGSGQPVPTACAPGLPSSPSPLSHCVAAPSSSEPPQLCNSVETSVSPATTKPALELRGSSKIGAAPPTPDTPRSQLRVSSGARVEPTGAGSPVLARDALVSAQAALLPPPPGLVSSADELPEWRRTLRPRAPTSPRRRRRRRGKHSRTDAASINMNPSTIRNVVPHSEPAMPTAREGNPRRSRRQSPSQTTGPAAGSTIIRADRRESSTSMFAAQTRITPEHDVPCREHLPSHSRHRSPWPPTESVAGSACARAEERAHISASRPRHPAHSVVHSSGGERRAHSCSSAVPSYSRVPPQIPVRHHESDSRSPRRGRSRKRRSRRRLSIPSPTLPRNSDKMSTSLATGIYAMGIAVAYMLRLHRKHQNVGEALSV